MTFDQVMTALTGSTLGVLALIIVAGAVGIYDWRRITTELRREKEDWKKVAMDSMKSLEQLIGVMDKR